MGTLLGQLRGDGRIRDALEESFDFIVAPPTCDLSWFRIDPSDCVEPIATNPSGGVFIAYGSDERVIHITSEGRAGVVGRDLREFLTILVTYPYWFDLLKFSGGGKLEEMKNAVKLEEQVRRHQPRLDSHRRLLIEQLQLPTAPAIITALHTAVRDLGRDLRVLGPDGSEYDSLFNKFSAARLQK